MQEKLTFKPKEEDAKNGELDTEPIKIEPIDSQISIEAKKQEEERCKEIKGDVDENEEPQIKSEIIKPLSSSKKQEGEKE